MGERRKPKVRSVRVNWRGLLAVAAAAALLAGGSYLLTRYQEGRVSRAALATARKLHKAGDNDLAVRHLNQHLDLSPADLGALRLKGEILTDAARSPGELLEAARAEEKIVRLDPEAPAAQDARRKLVDLYVRYGDTLRASVAGLGLTFADQIATLDSRYRVAETYAKQLIARGANDAEAHRLYATALDGLAVPGDRQAINEAVDEYRRVLVMDPADEVAAERLSKLYLGRLKDPARAEVVLGDLLRAKPDSVKVRLTRHRFFLQIRRDEKASAELEAATKLAPGDLDVLLAAAEGALRRGDVADARRQIAKVPPAAVDDIRVLLTRGMIDFGDERPDEAVVAWKRGLVASSGTDAEVTWWLCYALLQGGRIADARPLIAQYRRLVGGDTAMAGFLQAQLDESTGRPARAVATLEAIRDRLDERLIGMLLMARGRCYEALFDDLKAEEAYSQALLPDPANVVPRLALARVRTKRNPEEGVAELQRGLSLTPKDPALLVALAGALLRREAAKPNPRSRNWAEFDRAWTAAAGTAANSSLALMWADRLERSGREGESLKYLTEAVAENPRSTTLAVVLSEALSRRDKHAEALAVLEKASAPGAAGDQAALRVARARALVTRFRGREARAVLIRDVDRLPVNDRPQVWIALGQLETARGDVDSARAAYTEWARLLPDDPRPRLVLLELALDQRDDATVRARVEELRTLGGQGDISYRLGRAMQVLSEREAAGPAEGSRDVSLEEAALLVDGVLREAPVLPAAQFLHARVLEAQGRADEAVAVYERCWERGAGAALPRIINLLARGRKYDAVARLRATPGAATQVDALATLAFERVGDNVQASRLGDRLVQDLKGSTDAVGWQAQMLDHLGRLQDAESALRSLAERNPGDLDPWLTLVRYQADRHRTPSAAATVEVAKKSVKSKNPELVDARLRWASGDFPAATKAFLGAIAKHPDDVETRVQASGFFEQARRPTDAAEQLRAVLQLDPGNRAASRQLAVVLTSPGNGGADAWEKALEILGPEKENEAPDDRLARAVVFARSPIPARRDEALDRLDKLVSDVPTQHYVSKAAREVYARLLMERGENEKAMRVAAVSASGTDPSAIALYAKALIQSKKPEAAETQLDRLAAISPTDPREPALRAQAIWDRSRPEDAAAALERAYSVRAEGPGGDPIGREAFLLLANMGDSASATAERLGLKLARKHPEWSWMPALILARRGAYDEAIALLRGAARTGAKPEDLVETAKVAMTVAAASDDATTVQKIAEVLNSAVLAEPNSDELLIMSAMLRHIQGNYSEEVRLYRIAQEHRPDNFVILNNLAWALCEGLKQYDDALKLVETLIKVIGQNPQALDTRGVIYTRLGRYGEAIRDLEEGAKAKPGAVVYLHLARAYQLAERTDDSRRARDQAKQYGLTPKEVDPVERAELQNLMNEPTRSASR